MKFCRKFDRMILAGFAFVASGSALAAVPKTGTISNDTALYQNLTEIKSAREHNPNFDRDLAVLSSIERRYRESLPSLVLHPRLKAPIQRVSAKQYEYSGVKTAPKPSLR